MLCYYNLFFFNDTATTEIYTLSLHDALPIFGRARAYALRRVSRRRRNRRGEAERLDRKSTRLNSSHLVISYAVFCLKKKKKTASNQPSPNARLAKTTKQPESEAFLVNLLTRS